MKAILIDDNSSNRNNLKTLLTIYAPDVEVIAEASGVTDGKSLLLESKPDLVFLDIEMNDGTGFDLLAMLGKPNFKIIFVTAHDQFAIKAFKFSAIDYILKPVDPDDLVRAVEKAKDGTGEEYQLKIGSLLQNQKESLPKRIVLTDSKNTYLISIDEIIRCEADVNYTRFFLTDKRTIFVSKTLKLYHEILQEQGFFRCHQSHLINLRFFDRYDKSEGGVIHMKNDERVPISTRKKDELMSQLSKFS